MMKKYLSAVFLIVLFSAPELFCESKWEKFKSSFNHFDDRAVILINHSTNSDACDAFMIVMTMMGDGIGIVPIMGIILYFYDRKHFKFNFIFFITVLLIGGILVQILKYLFNRPRPLQRISDIKLLSDPLREHGFPSGHTMAIFTAATYLSKKIQKHAWLFLLVAVTVGISRIYVGVHFLSDVIGGAVIGICITEFFCWIFKIESDKNQHHNC